MDSIIEFSMQNDLGSQLCLKSEEHVCVVFYYKYIFALRYISRLKYTIRSSSLSCIIKCMVGGRRLRMVCTWVLSLFSIAVGIALAAAGFVTVCLNHRQS